jgi:hypothetical protein
MSEPDSATADHLSPLNLDIDRIVETIATLQRRVGERFPGSSLGRVCGHLLDIAERTRVRLAWVERPNIYLRAGTWAMAALVVVGVLTTVWRLAGAMSLERPDPLELIQAAESAIQEFVFVGVGLIFLLTMESRVKRSRALRFIRELRALAHIVDMHQLTKDPHRVDPDSVDTASSPARTLTRRELSRYLDYCSELLSLTSKVSALYAERTDDAVVLQAVDQVEDMTTGLSQKIWQKIMMLDEGGVSGEPLGGA